MVHWHKPYGQLELLLVPTDLWNSLFKEISLDWITGLPVSSRNGVEYDNILMVVCCVTKYALFLPTREDSTAVDLAQLFFEHVECHFETSRDVVINRDFHIISEFWHEICKIKIIKRHMLTAHHPQTDGQSKALNQIIENYLRSYIAEESNA